MNPAKRVLLPLVSRLRPWVPVILRSTHSEKITITLIDTGVEVQVVWAGGEMRKVFTNQELLGHTSTLPPQSWLVSRRPCYWARQIIGSILNQRGVG